MIETINGLTVAIEDHVIPFVENITLDCVTNEFGKEALTIIGNSDCC